MPISQNGTVKLRPVVELYKKKHSDSQNLPKEELENFC